MSVDNKQPPRGVKVKSEDYKYPPCGVKVKSGDYKAPSREVKEIIGIWSLRRPNIQYSLFLSLKLSYGIW